MTVLKTVEPFRGIDQAELDRIESTGRLIELRDGSRVFSEGDEADAVYAIVGGPGRIRIGTIDRGSKGLMIEVFGVGDIFGEIGVLDGGTRSADAIAEERVQLLRISRSTFLEAINANAVLGANLCLRFARHVRR